MSSDGHSALFHRVFELAMAASGAHQVPSIFQDQPDSFPNFQRVQSNLERKMIKRVSRFANQVLPESAANELRRGDSGRQHTPVNRGRTRGGRVS